MAGEKDNAAIRDAIAKSPERTARRLEGVGFDRDAYDFSGYSDADIVRSLQGGSYGDEDYARLTGIPVGGSDTKSDPKPTADVTGDVTVNPIKPIDDKPEPITRPTKPSKPVRRGTGQVINQTVNQGNHYGQITTGHITGNTGTINLSNDNNSTNTVGGNTQYKFGKDYRPDFMKFLL